MKTKVGAPSFGDDPGRTRRFAVAVPAAVALTVLFFALAMLRPPHAPPPEKPAVTTIALERVQPVSPRTPAPTPVPTPPPPVARVTLAPVQRAAPREAPRAPAHAAAAPAPPRRAPVVTVPAIVAGPAGSAAAPVTGNAPGSGTSAGDAGAAGGGTGGTGAGDGSGTGTVNADQPCGDVEFIPSDEPRYRGSTSSETIRATVRFPDGHTESAEFPYPWVYPDAADTDPWSPRNVTNPDFPARAQLPPPGADTSRFPALIRYILTHTRANGTTVLQDCPTGR